MNTSGWESTDLFCGAGGSGIGASAAGIRLVMAANHSAIAIDTHSTNFPDTEHDQADISQVDPRRYRRTHFLWASPECTSHSGAKGAKHAAQLDLFTAPDPVAERSRATMWDVPRFTECHRYQMVIVENVIEAARWEMWPAWLHAMRCLGYAHRVVSLNSMHAPGENAPRAPQSRDRIYVVFWRAGCVAPDLDLRPPAWCAACGREVTAVQWWKPGRAVGRYRAQYLYRCGTCRDVVEPYALPAAAAIDWTVPGRRIGDRDRPLKPATLARIRAGLQRYATVLQLVPAGGTWNVSTSPVLDPMRCRTSRETEGLLIPLEAREGKHAAPSWAPMRTQTARHETALVVPCASTGVAHPTSDPLPGQPTRDQLGIAFIAELRGGGSSTRPVTRPLATVTASGNHHMLIRDTPTPAPGPRAVPAVEDCTFRMLQVGEIQAAMAFDPTYLIKGTKREQVAQLGNAVTPCASEWLYRRCIAALERAR
ncbi:MAG: DNA cytosine methyltransferase [Pseudonocardiaceae bacterium]